MDPRRGGSTLNLGLVTAGWYVATSVVAVIAYGVDKRAASRDRRRVPEAWLHGMELVGGWPGALLAQQVFRHKTRKLSYQVVFWTIVVLHAVGWFLWFRYRPA
ncbi:MAG: DUF1294 domain-containing protein [Planctomycetota bacterium]